MKTRIIIPALFIFLVIFISKGIAQNSTCEDLISVKIDKMTSNKIVSSKHNYFVSNDDGKTSFNISLLKGRKSVTAVIEYEGGIPCTDSNDKATILLRDGSKLEIINLRGFKCDSQMFLTVGWLFGPSKYWKMLAKTEIETIRLYTGDEIIQHDIPEKISGEIRDIYKCFMDEI